MLYYVTTCDKIYDTAGVIILRVTIFLRQNKKAGTNTRVW